METFKKEDLLHGMIVTTRDETTGKCRLLSIRFQAAPTVLIEDYTDNLYYNEPSDCNEEHSLDIMRVALPSGAVLWERPIVELRVFDVALYKASRGAVAAVYENTQEMIMQNYHFNLRPWYMECDGKLCSFTSPSGDGVCCGYTIAREWTRPLTDDERRTWGKK